MKIYFFLSLLILVVVMLMYLLMLMLEWSMEGHDNVLSPYECGFETLSLTRYNFSYRFFLIAVLFLIFDVEIVLMFPVPFVNMIISSMTFLFLFVMILLLGLVYEMSFGTLSWMK
uniref:NADH-ubiquinone oxidoreductase chain 3 n=1 Tax=Hypochilus thorelli TaxID=139869 RepID=B2CKT7_HYPTH|nr:NADH dehydrogenase subunit 3 [Hypochilus thorelli]ACA62649.1 NADH dehydrogenase subunit 3 [Hypochilus thorelli]